ncbi:MAG: Gfo/Idh/MocA family oxidoreductase [Chloroflexi bacterium]|nr:Gfo/Idh/MocA family oxidoreductase [Chloroflexota bacterium]
MSRLRLYTDVQALSNFFANGYNTPLSEASQMKTSRRFLVIGGDSMGKRRIRCLQAHGVSARDIRLIDPRADRLAASQARYAVAGFADFATGWAWQPDVVVISTPTPQHMRFCLAAARAAKDFFCEIALSDSLAGAEELLALVGQHGLVAALGINNPSHTLLRQAKAWLQEESFGMPLTYQMAYGNYLPNWHPWEPYQDFYEETQIMGVIAQELGTLYTLLDTQVDALYAQSSNSGSLKIEGPDNLQILAQTTGGTAVTLQLDLLQDRQIYAYRIVSARGVIEIQLLPEARARRYLNASGQYDEAFVPKGYTFEQAYIDEFGDFLAMLDSRQEWLHPLRDGVHILRCLDAVKASAASGQQIEIGG